MILTAKFDRLLKTKENGELVVIANENYKQVVHKESLTNTNGELLDE